MATRKMMFYIGERTNPQLEKPYYVAYGPLFKKEVKAKEECSYGTMTLTGYEDRTAYDNELKRLEGDGFRVTKR